MTVPLLSGDQEAFVDAVARRVVHLLEERDQAARFRELVDAQTIAAILGVSRSTVYEHAELLGAIEVGNGSRPRLRFDVDQARAAWTHKAGTAGREDEVRPPTRAPRRRRGEPEDGLLPVRPGKASLA